MNSVAVSTRGVSRLMRSGYILHKIHLEFVSSETVLLVGHNGAGKSTLLRILSGLDRPDAGSVSWSLEGIELSRQQLWKNMGYCSQALQLYSQLTVKENFSLFLGLRDKSSLLDGELRRWQLSPHSTKRIAELSKGLQARVSMALTLVHEPRIVLLDEPTAFLDEAGARIVLDVLTRVREHQAKGVLIVASHDVSRFAPVCNRIVLLEQGRVALDTRALEGEHSRDDAKEMVISRYRGGNH